jgi:ATP-dependent DNA helicase 2 subunit 2
MADKEATVYIIDVGRTMGLKHNGREESDLDWSLKYLWERITHTVSLRAAVLLKTDAEFCQVSTGRKTALIGVIGLCTDGMEMQILSM